jgi:hypothetical protein
MPPCAADYVWARYWTCWASCPAHALAPRCVARVHCTVHARRAAAPSPHTWNATAGSALAAVPAATPWTCGWLRPSYRCMTQPWICVAGSTWQCRGCPPAVRPPLENTPDRAVELLAEPEARQGRTRLRKLRQVSNYWDLEPAMLPCVLVPDLAGFDWPAARPPEFVANKSSMSDDFLKAALPPSCSRTGRCAEHGVYTALRWSRFHPTTTPQLNARCRSDRFDWPTGGTEEFLGRWSARINSRHTEAKGVRADPLYVFGAVDRVDGNRNDRNSRRRRKVARWTLAEAIQSHR